MIAQPNFGLPTGRAGSANAKVGVAKRVTQRIMR